VRAGSLRAAHLFAGSVPVAAIGQPARHGFGAGGSRQRSASQGSGPLPPPQEWTRGADE